MPCETSEDGKFHISYSGPRKTLREDDLGEKWCFRCRTRRRFTEKLTAEIEPSYYDPIPEISCSEGHVNGDLFPGWIRTWDED